MELNSRKISRYQLFTMGFLGLLSPIIRLIPNSIVAFSGSLSIFSPILALIPLGALFAILNLAMKKFKADEGYCEMITNAFGSGLGKIVLIILALWLAFYVAFSLCSTATRYVATAYPNIKPSFFLLSLLLLSSYVATRPLKNLARSSELFFPLLFIILLLIFVFAFQSLDKRLLYFPNSKSFPQLGRAMLLVSNVVGLGVYVGFLEGKIGEKEKTKKTMKTWLLFMLITVFCLSITTIGYFGETLTQDLNHPFFALVRNIKIFGTVERIEALVLALWFVTDFVFVTVLIFVIKEILVKIVPRINKEKTKVLIISPVILGFSLLIGDDSSKLNELSINVVPYINLSLSFALIPLSALIYIKKS